VAYRFPKYSQSDFEMSLNPTLPTATPLEGAKRYSEQPPRPHNRGHFDVVLHLNDGTNYEDELLSFLNAFKEGKLPNDFADAVDRQHGVAGHYRLFIVPRIEAILKQPEMAKRAKEQQAIIEKRLTEIDRANKMVLPRHKSGMTNLQGSGVTLIVKGGKELTSSGFGEIDPKEDVLYLPHHHLENGKPVKNKEDYCEGVWCYPTLNRRNAIVCPRCGHDVLKLKDGQLKQIKLKEIKVTQGTKNPITVTKLVEVNE